MRRMAFLAVLALSLCGRATHVAAQSAGDKEMAQRIGNYLKDSGQLRDYRIGVKYEDGVAWLSGNVANEQQASAAMRLTQGINGIDHVVNNLSIAGGAPAARPASLELARPLGQASQQSASYQTRANRARPRVSHAYAPPVAPAADRTIAARGYRPIRRNNMPLPMNGAPIRQISAQRMTPMQAQYCGPCTSGGGGMYGGDGGGMYGGDGGGMYAGAGMGSEPMPSGFVPGGGSGVGYDNAQMPGYAWPSYSAYPNYAALSYPQQYSPSAWPYIGPFYPYPQVPLGWRKVSLEWDDGWWFLDFSDCGSNH
jgi:BON domain